jgi:hypothetical protein
LMSYFQALFFFPGLKIHLPKYFSFYSIFLKFRVAPILFKLTQTTFANIWGKIKSKFSIAHD